MTWRMPRRRQNCRAAVAEYVVVAVELGRWMLRLEAPHAKRVWPLVLGLLHQQHGLREQLHVADVVRMGMRNGDVFDVGRLHAELFKLRRECLRDRKSVV